MSCKSCIKPDRKGLTLVEVVVGTTLLAMLLVALLTIHRVHAAQIQSAKFRQTAIRIADELLDKWSSEQSIPQAGRSEFIPDFPQWRWRVVSCDPSSELEQVGIQTVRLEIVRAREKEPNEMVLAAVELLVATASPSQ